jgi:DNA-binding NtrC family response regulator
MSIYRVLVVDDDKLSREFLAHATEALGYQALAVSSGAAALEALNQSSFDLVLTDLRMPEMNGLELVERLQSDHPEVPSVVVTAHGSIDDAVKALRIGAADFLMKPCSPDTLSMVIDRLVQTTKLMQENDYLRSEYVEGNTGDYIAKSPRTKAVFESASRIANSKGTVLITGESGVGKECVAQFIHKNSPRVDAPFIRVNCAALSPQLLESELFGHEKGAFTGAHKTRPGRFELADGGTLLLDELGEISPALQAKLLRVLEEEEFERVGGNTTMKVDVRIIASTNRDLPKEVAEGRFREDLYYRLHVLPIHLPPLRERTEDIAPLSQLFAVTHAEKNGRPAPSFSHEALVRLRDWAWPGNVRELDNVIQRAVVLLQGDEISLSDLVFGNQAAMQPEPDRRYSHLKGNEEDIGRMLANRPIADIERIAILATLERTGGNKTEAARRLGVTARTLSNKMKLWKELGLVA